MSRGLIKRVLTQLVERDKQPLIKVVEKSLGSYALSAGGYTYTNIYSYLTSNIPSGYELGGIVGYTAGSGHVAITSLRPDNHSYSLELKNTANFSVTAHPSAWVMYVRKAGQ